MSLMPGMGSGVLSPENEKDSIKKVKRYYNSEYIYILNSKITLYM